MTPKLQRSSSWTCTWRSTAGIRNPFTNTSPAPLTQRTSGLSLKPSRTHCSETTLKSSTLNKQDCTVEQSDGFTFMNKKTGYSWMFKTYMDILCGMCCWHSASKVMYLSLYCITQTVCGIFCIINGKTSFTDPEEKWTTAVLVNLYTELIQTCLFYTTSLTEIHKLLSNWFDKVSKNATYPA